MKHSTWSDIAELVSFNLSQDAQGYEFPPPIGSEYETKTEIMCDFEDGVSRSEFYQSYKAGLQASATVTLWTIDYDGEKVVDFNGKRYSVIRSYVSEQDLTTLVLSEVVR